MAIILFLLFSVPMLINSPDQDSIRLKIELSIENDTRPVFFNVSDSPLKVYTPYLRITYKNVSNGDLYFKKILPYDDSLMTVSDPRDLFGLLHVNRVLIEGNTKISMFRFCPYRKFVVDMSNPEQKYSLGGGRQGSLLNYTHIYNENHHSFGNYLDIGLINNFISLQNNLDSTEQLIFFKYPGKKVVPYEYAYEKYQEATHHPSEYPIIKLSDSLTKLDINKFKDLFCFLKSGESFSQRVNLLSLLMIGGTYNFSLSNHRFSDNIKIYPIDFDEFMTGLWVKYKLPDEYDGFSLFIGTFEANELAVEFNKDCTNRILVLGSEKTPKRRKNKIGK